MSYYMYVWKLNGISKKSLISMMFAKTNADRQQEKAPFLC
jgi:hypothetical protein